MSIGMRLLLFFSVNKKLYCIWVFPSVLLLSIVMVFLIDLFIQQINSSSIYQYVWSWTINNDFSLEFGHLIDPLTFILLILITTVGILVIIYNDSYMSHDQGRLRFFCLYECFQYFNVRISYFLELVGMCFYLLIGFWFT
jgi:NAD(P)H-quinone oxidoreductase subunit 5